MGVVYLARDTKLGRAVALKFLPPRWMHDEAAKQRFLREAQAASATNHRNICIIHDIEETDDGQLFIVMAHYEGQTLKQKLESGPLPIAAALEIATEIAEGLAKAHSQGVVHRDIKPGNLMITDDGVKILDFGLAKLADAALKLTMEGSTVGTVAYMSPEQARGEEADERSDIWALGVVLYEMLTGQVPFKGTYPEAIFYAIKNEAPVPIAGTGKEIPETVERLVMRALAKDPSARYQNAREFARELRFLQGRSVPLDLRTEPLAVAPTVLPRRPKRVTLARVVAAVALLALACVGGYVWVAQPIPRTPIAIVPVANHTGEPTLAPYRLALTQSLINEFADSPNLRVASYPRILGILRRYIDRREDPSGLAPIQALTSHTRAEVLVVPSLEYNNGAWFAKAELRNVSTGTNMGVVETESITSALPQETVQRLMTALAADVQARFKVRWPHRIVERPAESRFRNLEAARAFEEGINAYDQMEYAAARDGFRRAVQNDPQRSIAHAWLSRASFVMGDTRAAEAAAQAASTLITPKTPRADALFAVAALAEAQNDLQTAEQRYRELAALHPDDAAGQLELADYLKRQNKNEPAVEAYHEALRLDSGVVRIHVDLCQLYSRLDSYELSEQHAQTALNNFRALANRNGEAQALLCYGDGLLQQGDRIAEARQHIEAAKNIFESLGHAYGSSRVYQYVGYLAGRERNYPAAAQAFAEALSRSRQLGNRQIEGLVLMNLGFSHQLMGRIPEALGYYQESRQVYQDIGDERRAAEQDVNAAGLEIDHGGSLDAALRRLANARATLHKLGYVDFELTAMQNQAQGEIAAGRLGEALRLLREASSIATERQMKNRVTEFKIKMAVIENLQANYDAARQALEPLVAGEDSTPEAKIVLGQTYLRIGDFAAARKQLDQAAADAHRTGEAGFAALAQASLGELANESGETQEALAKYRAVAALDDRNLPTTTIVEARCRLAGLDHHRNAAEREPLLLSYVVKARELGQRILAARCGLDLARVQLGAGRYDAAVDTLRPIQSEKGVSLGPEVDAHVHYLRGVALTGRRDTQNGPKEKSVARMLAARIQGSLPEKYRQSFSARASIRPLFE